METFSNSPITEQLHQALGSEQPTILRGSQGKDAVLDFACSTVAGLYDLPRRLECRFLYDARGSALFERITEQPEYYLTRTEASLLAAHADAIRDMVGPVTLTELGSGNSTKSEILLKAWLSRGSSVRYVPIDVSESALTCACSEIRNAYRSVQVVGVNAEYLGAFPLFRELSPAMVLFLGSSIGNFSPRDMSCFLAALAASLNDGDFFLVGLDLVKERSIIEAAYNDAAGVSTEFTRNVFARMNRELGSSINLNAVKHEALYVPEHEQVEIDACFTRRQMIHVEPLDKCFLIPAGEKIRVEICRKFSLESYRPYLESFGFRTEAVFTDPHSWFALVLLRREERLPKESQS